jgi:RNA polymerase sigma-70 factor, ECF subfamily
VVLSTSDRDLLHRCLEGTPEAWEAFVDRFLALVVHVVESTAGARAIELNEAARDDIVADVFLTLVDQDFRTLRRFREQSSLGTYLVVVARRMAIRKLGQLQRGRAVQAAAAAEPQPTSDSVEFDIENTEEVHALLARLPDSEATAVRMYHLEERSYREIGAQIGIPVNSVGPLLSQARAKLRTLRG